MQTSEVAAETFRHQLLYFEPWMASLAWTGRTTNSAAEVSESQRHLVVKVFETCDSVVVDKGVTLLLSHQIPTPPMCLVLCAGQHPLCLSKPSTARQPATAPQD